MTKPVRYSFSPCTAAAFLAYLAGEIVRSETGAFSRRANAFNVHETNDFPLGFVAVRKSNRSFRVFHFGNTSPKQSSSSELAGVVVEHFSFRTIFQNSCARESNTRLLCERCHVSRLRDVRIYQGGTLPYTGTDLIIDWRR